MVLWLQRQTGKNALPVKISLRAAIEREKIEQFIAEREAEGQAPSDAAKFTDLARRLAETPRSVQRTSKRGGSAG